MQTHIKPNSFLMSYTLQLIAQIKDISLTWFPWAQQTATKLVVPTKTIRTTTPRKHKTLPCDNKKKKLSIHCTNLNLLHRFSTYTWHAVTATLLFLHHLRSLFIKKRTKSKHSDFTTTALSNQTSRIPWISETPITLRYQQRHTTTPTNCRHRKVQNSTWSLISDPEWRTTNEVYTLIPNACTTALKTSSISTHAIHYQLLQW